MKNHFEAAIINMDGVITRTASAHAKAWKMMFDEYNIQREKDGKGAFEPFRIEVDYPMEIDGIPRYDGVKNFLDSRGVRIPYGQPADAPGTETIYGLGNLKNKIFLDIIEQEGVEVCEKNIEQIRCWKSSGMKVAVISSSANCKRILEACGIGDLFDVRVDGIVLSERGIKGKPAPDIFIEAAKDLRVPRAKAFVVEDSPAGVEAGKRGHFGLVVGVQVNTLKGDLRQNGADEVVKSLSELTVQHEKARPVQQLPSALREFDTLKKKFSSGKLFIFLDFDGTLSPIVDHYEDAILPEKTKALLEKMQTRYPLTIISGRGLDDVRSRVGLKNIHYAGSHGYEIEGPGYQAKEKQEAKRALQALNEIENNLASKLKLIEGAHMERKRYALAVHYRQVDEALEGDVFDLVQEEVSKYDAVTTSGGKKVIEIKPDLDWHKGKAVELLMREFAAEEETSHVLYIGDDLTDEDAFRVIKNGTGILVGSHGELTAANYQLKDVDEVNAFLTLLL